MRKIFTLFIAAMMVMTANAQYTRTLPLDYTDFFRADAIAADGAHLEKAEYASTTQGDSLLLADQWNRSGKSADQSGENPAITASTLEYSNYIDNKKGSEISLLDLGGSSQIRSSIYSLCSDNSYTGRPYYLAALVQITSATGKGDFLTLDANFTANAQRGRLFTNKEGNGYKLGLGWGGDPTLWSGEFAFGSTHLVVIKVTPDTTGNNENAEFWIDPDLSKDENNNTPFSTIAGTSDKKLSAIRGITIRQRTKIAGKIAGLRFGTSWADVMGMAADALLLESSNPAQNGYVEPMTTSLSLTFNKEIERGNGTITLTEIGGESLPLTPIIEGKLVTLPVSLLAEKEYRLSVTEGAFVNGAAANVAIDIDFTTKNPDVYAVEEFRYTAGADLEGQGGWVVSTATADQGGKSPLVGEAALAYAGYGASEKGYSMVLDSIQQEISGELKRNTVWPFIADQVSKEEGKNVVYTAFMINLSEMNSTSGKDIFAYLKQGAEAGANTTMRGRVQVKIEKDKMVFGIRKNSEEITQWSDSVEKAETALLVIKYVNKSTSSSSDADEFYMYVNPDPSKTEAENSAKMQVADGNDAGGGADLRYLCFRQMKLNATISGIRVAKTWEQALRYTAVEPDPDPDPDPDPEGIEDVPVNGSSYMKVLHGGQLYIIREGRVYTISGQLAK